MSTPQKKHYSKANMDDIANEETEQELNMFENIGLSDSPAD